MDKIPKFLFVLLTILLFPIALVALVVAIMFSKIFKGKLSDEGVDYIEEDDFSACIKD